MIGIYLLIFASGAKYVGQSINVNKRFNNHISQLRNGTHYSAKITKEYEENGFPQFRLLKECLEEELDLLEEQFIKELNPELNVLKYSTSSPNYYGESANGSRLTNDEYLSIFRCLQDPKLSLNDVALMHDVPYSLVNNIAQGSSHKWLQEQYPEEYLEMRECKRARSKCPKLQKFPTLRSPTGELVEIEGTCADFAKKHNIQRSNLSAMLNGRLQSVSGWRIA